MVVKIDEVKRKVTQLLGEAGTIQAWIKSPNMLGELRSLYERWYVTALRLVAANLSTEELERFIEAYNSTSTQGYLMADDPSRYEKDFSAKVARQKGMVAAIPDVIETRALDLRNLAISDVLGNEMKKARFLLEQGLVREAGVIAGIALEGHLKLLHLQSSLQYSASESLVDLAQHLRREDILTLGHEKRVIAMADTRNKCAHKRDEEPSLQEVEDLLDDAATFMKRTEIR